MIDDSHANNAARWLTVAEACKEYDISERTLRRRIQHGIIMSKMEGGRRLVLADSVAKHAKFGGTMAAEVADNPLIEQLRSENEYLRQHVKKLQDEMRQKDERHDTIVLQLTRQLEQSQRLLEYQQEPWYRRWFRKNRTREEEMR